MTDFIPKRCILRLKTDEIFPILRRWSFLSLKDIEELTRILSGKQTKKAAAELILKYCNDIGGLTAERAGELDLIYVQKTSTKKSWSAYMFTDSITEKVANVSVNQIKKKLVKYLRLYFNKECCVTVMLYNGVIWGRVYLPKGGLKTYQPTRCLYFVHYPQTPVIIINGWRASYSEFITQCFVGAFGYTGITDISLNGHHQESLAELAINKHSQGGFNRFRRERRLSGPVEESPTRKRKVPDELLDERIVDENRADKRMRLEALEDVFGEDLQPKLEKIEYRVELAYRGKEKTEELKQSGELFKSKVIFKGSNVLEGLRNLAEHGYASVPLPKHLSCVPTRARNYFLLSKPRKEGEKSRIALGESGTDKTNTTHSETTQTKTAAFSRKENNARRTSPRSQKR